MEDSHTETYYNELWRSDTYGSARPNDEEKGRAGYITRLIEKQVLPAFPPLQKLTVLDLGCGRGWLTNLLSQYGPVTGADPVEAAIQRARELHPRLQFRVGETSQLLSEGLAGSFQLVVATEVIEHVPDEQKERFLREIYRLLAPSGFLLLTTPRAQIRSRWESIYGKANQPIEDWISEAQLKAVGRSVGFQTVGNQRIFVEGTPFRLLNQFLQSKRLPFLSRLVLKSRFFAPLRNFCSVYQIALFQRR